LKKQEIRKLLKEVKTMQDIPELLIQSGLNNNLCELGVFGGNGINLLIRSNPKRLIGIDIWTDDGNFTITDGMDQNTMNFNYQEALKIKDLHPSVEYIKDYTFNCVDKFKDGYFDFIYIDADHSYQGCKNDLNQWWSKVKVGGIISGHDYFVANTNYDFGVIEAVDEFRIENEILDEDFYVTPETYAPSWFIIKTKKNPKINII
jgi:hypothetical protein